MKTLPPRLRLPRHVATGSLAVLVLSLSLGTTAGAQGLPVYEGPRVFFRWDEGTFGPGSFGRALALEFVGNRTPDVLVHSDGTLILKTSPGIFQAADDLVSQKLPWQVTDFDRAPGLEPDAGLDAVVFVNEDGLHLGYFQPDDGTESGPFQTVLLEGNLWRNARAVRFAAGLGDDGPGFVGVHSDGETILRANFDGSKAEVLFSVYPVFALEVLDWDSDGVDELAMATTLGLEIRRSDTGQVEFSQAGILPGDALAPVRQDDMPDRIAWLTTFPTLVEQSVIVYGRDDAPELVQVGPLQVVGIVAGDVDQDGDDDLVLSHRTSHDPLLLTNQRTEGDPGGTSFNNDLNFMLVLPTEITSSAADNETWPVIADFDNEGTGDVFYAVRDADTSVLFTGLEGGIDPSGNDAPDVDYAGWTLAGRSLNLLVDVPAPVTFDANGAELVVYRQPTIQSEIETEPFHRDDTLVVGPANAVAVPVPEQAPEFDTVYHIMIRAVRLEAGVVREAGPPAIYSWGGRVPVLSILQLDATGPTLDVLFEDGGSAFGGGLVPRPKIGPSRNGGPPLTGGR